MTNPTQPRTRGECACGPRPCPWVGCRYHLLILEPTRNLDALRGRRHDLPVLRYNKLLQDLTAETIEAFPALALAMLPETCALDVAEEGGKTFEAVAELFGTTRERIRQLQAVAFERLLDDPESVKLLDKMKAELDD